MFAATPGQPANQNPLAAAATTVANAANGAMAAATGAVNGAVAAATNAVNGAANAIKNAVPPAINSLIPFTNTAAAAPAPAAAAAAANNKKNGNGGVADWFGMGNNGAKNKKNNAGTGFFENISPPATIANVYKANNGAAAAAAGGFSAITIFIALVGFFVVVFVMFKEQIMKGYEYAVVAIKQALGVPLPPPDVQSEIVPIHGETKELSMPPPVEAGETTVFTPPPHPLPSEPMPTPSSEGGGPLTITGSIVEKILPSSAIGSAGKEVFNVSQNNYTYYDAEPLCKALGAQLATYDQVKEAWSKGADWCNYGWVKGQMAIYPTQKETYEKLQQGPPEDQAACGTVGVNGGFFDNPDMRFGVNCYGAKPVQKAFDEKILADQGAIPKTVDSLKVDQKAAEFKAQLNTTGILPFNEHKWSSSFV